MAFKMKGFTPFTKVNPIDSIKDKFSTVKSAGDNLKSKLADKASDVKAKVKSKATDLKNIAAEKVKEKVEEIEKWISVRKGLNRYPLIRDPKEKELYDNLRYWLEN